jgi:hypothetical protein
MASDQRPFFYFIRLAVGLVLPDSSIEFNNSNMKFIINKIAIFYFTVLCHE